MTDRIIEVAEGPVRLRVRLDQLVIERHDKTEVTTPLAEIACLLLSTPHVQFSQAVIAGIAAIGGSVVVCDAKHLPAAMMLPLVAHFIQTERFGLQAQLSEPRRKRLWQQLVQAKIRAQSALLRELHEKDGGIGAFAERVRSGDPENVEAQAARRYWTLLFGDKRFLRNREAEDQNRYLNYGYTVLRAAVARAICAAGLHPSFGLAHRNRYDTFSLASDLMEPFRPVVDRAVALWVREHDPKQPLDPRAKQHLISALQARYPFDKEERTLPDILVRSAQNLAQAVLEKEKKLDLLQLGPPCGTG
jgi:CRISPR-associated protein Cas1